MTEASHKFSKGLTYKILLLFLTKVRSTRV